MKIIYAPEYEGEKLLPLTDDRPCLLDVTYVGNMGLLSQLELRLGISCDVYADIEREALFVRAIRQQEDNLFYPAAQRDELGTAHQLLQWRDALLMAGWNPKMEQPSEKLSALAELEKNFSGIGVADRWLEVMHFATEMDYDLTGVEMAVETAEQYLPLVIRKTLQGVNAHGAKVTFCSHWEGKADKGSDLAQLQTYLCGGKLPRFKGDASLRVLRFTTPNEAYEWFAHLPEQSGMVAVNENGELLNHVLSSWNLPLTHAECREGNPQITQLFKLGLSLFERPLNIYNLLSYLQIPLHPIPAMLRRKLADVICNEGGIGDKWHQTIEEFVFAEEEKEAKKIRRKKSIFWEMVEQQAKPDKEQLLAYNRALREWAQGLLHSDKEEKRPDALTVHQLNALSTFCSTFALLVEDEETIDNKKLEELVKSVYRPTHYVTSEAQQHGVTTLPDIKGLTAETGQLVWLDCVNKPAAGDAYGFLTMEERRLLNEAGMEIPPHTEVLQEQREAMVRSLCRVKQKLTVVTTAYEGNTQTNEHPFVTELKILKGDAFAMETPEVDRKLQVELPTDWREPQGAYQVPGMEVPTRKQSNTSLTQLIHFPFNYVTEYIARLKEPKLSELKDIKTTKGLVAHHFVDGLVKAAKKKAEKGGKSTRAIMRQLFEKHFEEWVERAIGETGTLLLLQENQFEKKTFILQLKKSTESLLTIMEELQLEPVDCEVEINLDPFFDYGGLGGSIDCLLQNAEGEYVIFDFKWSENRDGYQQLIEKGTAMQLELYRWAVEKTYGRVAGMGYYLFPLCQLLTGDYAESGDVKHIDTSKAPAEPFIKRMQQSIAFRREQLKKGVIEEAEELCFTEIDYAQQMEDKQLLPLQVKYGEQKAKDLDKKHKASPYVKAPLKNRNEKPEINEIPTTHAILKARLK